MNSLQEQILEEEREGFKIDDLQGATWAFRKLRAIEEKHAEVCFIAEQEKVRVESWLEKEKKNYEEDKGYFQFLLSEYYKEERAKDKKFKLSTPYGKVTSRKSKSWKYEDEPSLIKYLKDSELPYVRVKEEVNKADLKKAFKDGVNAETGEILPFITIEETESITVKVE